MSYKLSNAGLRYVGENYLSERPAYLPDVPYKTYPLGAFGQLAPPAPLPAPGFSLSRIPMRQVLIGVVVIVIVALIMRQLMKLTQKTAKVERNAVVSRLSTKELAQRLYDRLDAKGRANPATMRSLERIGR